MKIIARLGKANTNCVFRLQTEPLAALRATVLNP